MTQQDKLFHKTNLRLLTPQLTLGQPLFSLRESVPFDFVRDARCARGSSAISYLGLPVAAIDRRGRLQSVKLNRNHDIMAVRIRHYTMMQCIEIGHHR